MLPELWGAAKKEKLKARETVGMVRFGSKKGVMGLPEWWGGRTLRAEYEDSLLGVGVSGNATPYEHSFGHFRTNYLQVVVQAQIRYESYNLSLISKK